MNCMKCGRDIAANQVFCPDCLEEMEKYPVQPNVAIHLPAQSDEELGKKPARRYYPVLSAEEQLKRMRKRISGLVLALILVSTLAISLGVLAYEILIHNNGDKLLGQNYSTVETSDTPGNSRSPDFFGFSD